MKTRDTSTKKQLIIFFLITYGVNFLLGIPLIITEYIDFSTFALFMMLLPATGVAFASLTKSKLDDENRVVHYIYIGYFSFYLGIIILRLTGMISKEIASPIALFVYQFISIGLFLYTWQRKQISALYPFINGKIAKKIIISFIIYCTVSDLLALLIYKGNILTYVIELPLALGFFTECIFTFGEEYGWRGFLQEKMQQKFGKRMGVILLGLIWELWHMPLWFTEYNLTWSEVLLRVLTTPSLAVFLGYVYMKTKNVWTCAFLHFLFNLSGMAASNALEHVSYTHTQAQIANLFIHLSRFAFIVFIFSKEYRKDEDYG